MISNSGLPTPVNYGHKNFDRGELWSNEAISYFCTFRRQTYGYTFHTYIVVTVLII